MKLRQSREIDFGKRSGLKVYPVSIGAMRLPAEELAIPLIRQAIDAGMIYIDTSRGYGDSEIKIGKALKDGYRQKVILSSKWCPWCIKVEPTDDTSADSMYKRILDSMQRLDVGYIDFYQVWNMSTPEQYADTTRKGGMLDGILRAMDEGLVGHTGFTTHDKPENVSRYIDQADWAETILFSYNAFKPDYKEVIAKAHDKGIATTVMNPVAGGRLTEPSPVMQQVVDLIDDAGTITEVAHRYLAGDENVDTILCGITKTSDVTSTISNYQKPPLTAQQRTAVESALEKLSITNMDFCTSCGYCMPCPADIKIPQMMTIIHTAKMLQLKENAKKEFRWHVYEDKETPSAHPSKCLECGQCEQKCPQKLNITDHLKYFTNGQFDKE